MTPIPLITAEQLMARFAGVYKSRKAFVEFARRTGLPRVRLNRKVILYDEIAVEAWLRKRGMTSVQYPSNMQASPKPS